MKHTAIGAIENDIEAFKLAISGDQRDIRRELSRFGERLNVHEKEAREHTDKAEKTMLSRFDELRYRVEKLAENVRKLAEGASSISGSLGKGVVG